MPGGIYPPLSVIKTWPAPNYVDPPTRSGMLVSTVVLTVLALFIVGARLFVRGVMQRSLGLDDLLCGLAMIPAVLYSVAIILAARLYYWDRHVWDIPQTAFLGQRKIGLALQTFYICSTGPIKISILLFYRRIKGGVPSKRYLWLVRFSIASVVVYVVAGMILLIIDCQPISENFTQSTPEHILQSSAGTYHPHCIKEFDALTITAVLSLSQDLVAAIIPTWLFWSIQLEKHQKYALALVFVFGYFVCAIAACRVYIIYVMYNVNYDFQWNSYPLLVLSMVEINLGATLASLPPLKVLFRRIRHWKWGSRFFAFDPSGYNESGTDYGTGTYGSNNDDASVHNDNFSLNRLRSQSSKPSHYAGNAHVIETMHPPSEANIGLASSSERQEDTFFEDREPSEERQDGSDAVAE